MDALEFLKLVLDPQRLAVMGVVAARPATSAELAEATGQPERDVLGALAPLVAAGVVRRDGGAYRLEPEALRELARDLPRQAPPARAVLFGMTEEEAIVLARFFHGERLVEIPTQRNKRLVVLERLALEFEPGVRYAEAEVNAVLGRFHDDYAALRRHMVEAGLLDRAEGRYWRSGGRVDPGV